MSVSFHSVSKTFADGTTALDRLDLSFAKGELLVILGPSGCGKSTACRILAGLESPSAGKVEVDGKDITRLPPRERGMSMVFQSYALYPHKTVYENIAYPLRVRGAARAEIELAVRRMAEMLELTRLLDRRPRQLSGGEAQRVAVARALVWKPQICLMDEPLSNLDALLRLRTRIELKRLHAELGQTFVFVTHDQEEAMSLGTRVAVLQHGKLAQLGTPHEIYHRPATRFVAEFIGKPAANTLEGEVVDGVFHAGELAVPLSSARGRATAAPLAVPVVLAIRPEELELVSAAAQDAVAMTVQVVDVVPPDAIVSLARGHVTLLARQPSANVTLRAGDTAHVRLRPDALSFFSAETGRRLEPE